jgi:hypothetical protein
MITIQIGLKISVLDLFTDQFYSVRFKKKLIIIFSIPHIRKCISLPLESKRFIRVCCPILQSYCNVLILNHLQTHCTTSLAQLPFYYLPSVWCFNEVSKPLNINTGHIAIFSIVPNKFSEGAKMCKITITRKHVTVFFPNFLSKMIWICELRFNWLDNKICFPQSSNWNSFCTNRRHLHQLINLVYFRSHRSEPERSKCMASWIRYVTPTFFPKPSQSVHSLASKQSFLTKFTNTSHSCSYISATN